ncbi:Ni/Fe hydrogenase subunit alpha [uncultured Desulfosarcina sp.]|uniref:Ni/Fe hydrogenase subunit alpha n=1 Tax=uncultured Desulfosarcina sp. TaxID=218289 RepID=UPI0029C8205B|nr:Ni/Fe hydrogenase subunit alpha [uncultured Desulfosarcina sp.]
MSRRIRIDPVTRLEGHGRIEIRLDDAGNVTRSFFQVPEFRGFEKFCEGRAAEEMPTLTQKICGVCPTAHHIAGVKALDALFAVEPPPAARTIRELMHTAFVFEDHLLHFFYLGGPDILVNGAARKFERNVFGVLKAVGDAVGQRAIQIRKKVRDLNALLGGSALYPVCGLPGGVAKPVSRETRTIASETAAEALAFARDLLPFFREKVLKNDRFRNMARSSVFSLRTYYMGLVDKEDRVNFYDGDLKIVAPDGKTFARFPGQAYLEHLRERVVQGSYMKILYLKALGCKGYKDDPGNGMYRVGPLARLNAAAGMATPLAQREYERLYHAVGEKPAHNTLLYHWARLIEVLYAAERMVELAARPELTDPHVRNLPVQIPSSGVGVCEAPRGTLIHHYQTDERAIVKQLNLVVATQNNAGAISLSVEKVARALIKKSRVTDNTLNMVEMAYRAYDPCLACATH